MCQVALCNLHLKQSYAHLNIGTELKTICTDQYLDRKSCLTINKHDLRQLKIATRLIQYRWWAFQLFSKAVWWVSASVDGGIRIVSIFPSRRPQWCWGIFYRMRVGGLLRTMHLQAFRNHRECGVWCGHVMSPKRRQFCIDVFRTHVRDE